MTNYTIIGTGRVATHLAHYFDSLSLAFRCWGRRTPREGPLVRRFSPDLSNAIGKATHVLVLLSDDAIEEFLLNHESQLAGRVPVHFSGSLVTPMAQGTHPLMTFSGALYPPDCYRRIPFVVERGRLTFQELLPGLPNPSFSLDPSQKPLYHALCVLSGNFSSLLWSKFFRDFEGRLGLPREAGYPYMEQIFRNLTDLSIDPVTGPLVRKDAGTIARNLEALSGDPYSHVYEGFLKAMGLKEEKSGD